MPAWLRPFCDLVEAIGYGTMLIPISLAWQRRWGLRGGMKPLAFLPAYMLSMAILMKIAAVVWRNNLPVIHVSTVGETLLYLVIYHTEFKHKRAKKIIRILAITFLIFAAVDSFYLEGFSRINSFTNLLESIIVTGLALLYFERTLIRRRNTQLQRVPLFIATIGIIMYLSGTVVIYLATNHFIDTNDEYGARLIFLLNSALIFTLALLFARAFLLVDSNPQSSIVEGHRNRR
ncbi:hypothetical protein [Hymenobacter pini]|uniref:hypothetical protein n=1 Tax=Hymenobacter pini TaxID=2880879 RepID=UPI001CF1312D|nr:hypothetical protein [Hymenobacter pini]